MNSPVKILGPDGTPLAPSRKQPAMALSGGNNVPYDAADRSGAHTAEWQPYLWSPDGELNPWRDTIVARMRDLVRNDGWASGTVTRILDNAVGANFRPIAKPDYRALALQTGIKGFDEQWAYEYSKALDASYRGWATSRGKWCDVQRRMTASQMYRLGFRHKLIDGDALAMMQWRPERCGTGRARYATAVQMIDPDRLSNPQYLFDQQTLRGGCEVDEDGVTVAYHIRRAHQGDWFSAAQSLHWDRIERETEWGRPVIVHDFDVERSNQHRGGVGILGPVVNRLKMLFRYDVAELDSAILNAVFGAWLESPFDQEFAEEAFNGGSNVGAYQDARLDYHSEAKIKVPGTGAGMAKLFPGEKINFADPKRPSANFANFEKAVLRNVASAAGMSAQQVSNDWSDVNYSSARGAMLEFWKTMTRRRDDFAVGFCQPIFSGFVEEAHDIDDLPMPSGAPDFLEYPEAYARAKWIGPGRGWIDPVNEVKGAILGMDAALMDYDELCAEQGIDGDDMILSRKNAIRRFKEAGLEPPSWAGLGLNQESAQKTIQDPEVQ
jgi:lambda family phage portal protein